MSVFSIAFHNFKNNIKIYLMFFVSMIVSVCVLSNFLILMDGEILVYLGELNTRYTKIILQLVSVVLMIFIFFFLWYSSNIFLKNRKKEIGIYTFMGVGTGTIGRIYFVEMMLIGVFSCILGVSLGVLFSKFFQAIVFYLAGFEIDVKFNVAPISIIKTVLVFMGIFLFMSAKGLVNIARSKVIDLLNDSRKTEKMPKINALTFFIAIISIGLISYGYYLVIYDRSKAMATLLLVCVGTYGLFFAVIPAVLAILIKKKSILYKGENILTINSLAYRIKKNYTTYATISILTACTVTVLGTAVSMKKLYESSIADDVLYTASFYSRGEIEHKEMEEILAQIGSTKYEIETTVLEVPISEDESCYVLSYPQFMEIVKENGNIDSADKLKKEQLSDDQVVFIQRPGTLASLIEERDIKINAKTYQILNLNTRFKTLGSLMKHATLIVNEKVYEEFSKIGQLYHFYGLKVENDEVLEDRNMMKHFVEEMTPYVTENISGQIGVFEAQKIEWLKAVYAIGAFLFLVFILAEASIIYIKIYSDANEDKNKYKILSKIGVEKREVKKAIRKEISLFYSIPLLIGLLHSYAALYVLGKFLSISLVQTFIISVAVCMIIFLISCIISIGSFNKIVGVNN